MPCTGSHRISPGPGLVRARRAPRRAAIALRALGCLLLAAASGCNGHEFLRVSENAFEGRLETAWVWFDPPRGGQPVVLVNMIHFGSPEYYEEVQARLDRAAVVFIEGIRPTAESRPDSESRPRPDALARLEQAAADLAFELGLVTQRDALVARPTYVCADWSEDELMRRASLDRYLDGLSRLRETVQEIVDQEALRLRQLYPEISFEDLRNFVRRGPLRRRIAEQLLQPPIEDPAIIVGRNEAVLSAVRQAGGCGVIAICYGADHGSHLARSLEALGYRRRCESWHRVFGFDREPHPDVVPRAF